MVAREPLSGGLILRGTGNLSQGVSKQSKLPIHKIYKSEIFKDLEKREYTVNNVSLDVNTQNNKTKRIKYIGMI